MNIKNYIAIAFTLFSASISAAGQDQFIHSPFPIAYIGDAPYPLTEWTDTELQNKCCDDVIMGKDWSVIQNLVVPENGVKLVQVTAWALGYYIGDLMIDGKPFAKSGSDLPGDWTSVNYNTSSPTLTKGTVIKLEFTGQYGGAGHLLIGKGDYIGGPAIQKTVTFNVDPPVTETWALSGPAFFYARFERVSSVPEPSAIALTIGGLLIMWRARRFAIRK